MDAVHSTQSNILLSCYCCLFPEGVFRIKIDEMGAAVKRYEVQDVLISDPRSRLVRAQWTVDGSTARLVNGER